MTALQRCGRLTPPGGAPELSPWRKLTGHKARWPPRRKHGPQQPGDGTRSRVWGSRGPQWGQEAERGGHAGGLAFTVGCGGPRSRIQAQLGTSRRPTKAGLQSAWHHQERVKGRPCPGGRRLLPRDFPSRARRRPLGRSPFRMRVGCGPAAEAPGARRPQQPLPARACPPPLFLHQPGKRAVSAAPPRPVAPAQPAPGASGTRTAAAPPLRLEGHIKTRDGGSTFPFSPFTVMFLILSKAEAELARRSWTRDPAASTTRPLLLGALGGRALAGERPGAGPAPCPHWRRGDGTRLTRTLPAGGCQALGAPAPPGSSENTAPRPPGRGAPGGGRLPLRLLQVPFASASELLSCCP